MNDPPRDRLALLLLRSPDPDARIRSESLWGERLAPDRYRLWNVPAVGRGYAYHDVVGTRPAPEGIPEVVRPIFRSGHSTVLLTPYDGVGVPRWFEVLWQALKDQGCGYEGGDGSYAVDVPPEADPGEVCQIIRHGVQRRIWSADVLDWAHPGAGRSEGEGGPRLLSLPEGKVRARVSRVTVF